MDLSPILTKLRQNDDFMRDVAAWKQFPARKAQTAVLPTPITPALQHALRQRGIDELYTHQVKAITAVSAKQNVIIATATSSGKSLCYTIPVMERLLANPASRALYLFPTKALAQDQLAEAAALANAGDLPIAISSYDGDTPSSRRTKIRRGGGILISNPDMMHAGILPYHTSWRGLFANLDFIVLDEIHTYRGVFGSHVGNVIRRISRLCAFYGSSPQFICCSATIANPQAHAERLTERPFILIDEQDNGAPTGEKQFILYTPPIVDEELGLRGSITLAAKDAAVTFLRAGVQTITFARARQTVELLLTYLREEMDYRGGDGALVAGYRGGYLPSERREIERGLRDGAIRGVVATNALELGIDIGQLDAAVLTGYPGSIASVWQQAGRAGRRRAQSVAILIAGNSPLEQYLCRHPDYIFERSPENALINPDNLRIMMRHLACAAYELPFMRDENYGGFGSIAPLLEAMEAMGDLRQSREQFHWVGQQPPASTLSLRSGGDERVLIHDLGEEPSRIIGEIDLESVPYMLYEGAVYLHRARSFVVERLDWDNRLAYVLPAEVDYYTRATVGITIRELRPEAEVEADGLLAEGTTHAWGDVNVVTQATAYRKIKRYTHETLGYGTIELPEMELETVGYWFVVGEQLAERLFDEGILLRPNSYGPNWQAQRQRALSRDGYRCQLCGAEQEGLHVHHKRPFRQFNYIPHENENYKEANQVENLVTLCPTCHRRAEAGQQTRSAMAGLAYLLRNLAPLYLMCDPADIEVSGNGRHPLTQLPTVVIYERDGGVGLSEALFERRAEIMRAAAELVSSCRCRDGCPACVGPPDEIESDTKEATAGLLRIMNNEWGIMNG